jgi:cytochrome c oxidase subunit 4
MSEVSKAVASGAHRVDAHASSNQDPHAEHHLPMSTYVIVFIALMVLLVITVVAAFINLGEANMIVAMTIAIIKAALVILYFMHVKFASRLTKVFVAASFVWLSIMFVLTWTDYISRPWLSSSRGWNENPVKADYDAGTANHGHPAPAETHGTAESHEAAPGLETKQHK